jgi:hypothetical protein
MALVSAKTKELKENYHHTFEIRKNDIMVTRHTLLLNPQSLSQNELSRSNITQTLGGSYVADFGSGLPTVSIGGTTGYKQRYNADGELRDGYEEFIHFRNMVFRLFIQTNDPDFKMYWYNWEDEEYWVVQPNTFRLQRSTAETLLYRYELAFTCLCKAIASVLPSADITILDFHSIGISLLSYISAGSEALSVYNQAK